jgi:hypothetical protein
MVFRIGMDGDAIELCTGVSAKLHTFGYKDKKKTAPPTDGWRGKVVQYE